MSPVLCAFAASILQAFNAVMFRRAMQQGADAWEASLLFYILAGALILTVFPFPDLSVLSAFDILLLSLTGGIWIVIMYCDLKAFQYLEASACAALSTVSIVLLCWIGCVVYQESFSMMQAAGTALIISTICFSTGVKAIPMNRGLLYKAGSISAVTLAFTIDKHLATAVPREAILYFGYGIPLVFAVLRKPSDLLRLPELFRSCGGVFLLVSVASVCRFHLVFFALAAGSLGITYTVLKTGILFVFLFEVLLLRMREGLARKALACIGCLAGAIIIGS